MKEIGKNQHLTKQEIQKGKNYFLGIGIDSYYFMPKLSNAVNDIERLSEILIKKYDFDDFIKIYDREATRKNIILSLRKLTQTINVDDSLVIYYSGHGLFDQILDRAYWLPADSNPSDTSDFISNAEIVDYISQIDSKHTLLISDSCFSGAFIATYRSGTADRIIKDLYEHKSRMVFSSGQYLVSDGIKGQNSPFASVLIEILDNNNQQFIRSTEIFDKVQKRVRFNSEQLPLFGPLANTGHEGGDFIFFLKDSFAIEDENVLWEKVSSTTEATSYQNYLNQYPNNKFNQLAKEKLRELELDNFVYNLCRRPEDYKQFIIFFPNSTRIKEAQEKTEISIIKTIQICRDLISNGDKLTVYTKILVELLQTAEGRKNENRIRMFQNRYKSLQNEKFLGTMNSQEYSLAINQIDSGLLDFLTELESF